MKAGKEVWDLDLVVQCFCGLRFQWHYALEHFEEELSTQQHDPNKCLGMDMHEISTDSQAAHMWIDLDVYNLSPGVDIFSYHPDYQPDIAHSSTVPKCVGGVEVLAQTFQTTLT